MTKWGGLPLEPKFSKVNKVCVGTCEMAMTIPIDWFRAGVDRAAVDRMISALITDLKTAAGKEGAALISAMNDCDARLTDKPNRFAEDHGMNDAQKTDIIRVVDKIKAIEVIKALAPPSNEAVWHRSIAGIHKLRPGRPERHGPRQTLFLPLFLALSETQPFVSFAGTANPT